MIDRSLSVAAANPIVQFGTAASSEVLRQCASDHRGAPVPLRLSVRIQGFQEPFIHSDLYGFHIQLTIQNIYLRHQALAMPGSSLGSEG